MQGPSAGNGLTAGSAKNRVIDIPRLRRNRRECAWHNPVRCLGRPPVDMRRHPETAHPAGRPGNGGNSGAEMTCSAVIPTRMRRAKHRQHSPPILVPWAVAVQPSTRHSVRPSSGCRAGKDSTRIVGSHPASTRNAGSSNAAKQAAGPTNTVSHSTRGNSHTPSAADPARTTARQRSPGGSGLLAGAGHHLDRGPQPAQVRMHIHL